MTDLQIFMTVEEAAKALRIGRTRMFALIASGEVESVLIGRSRRISIDALREFAYKLPQDAA
ncbi:excisionase family DNA-binding protein [Kribbella sp. VKM Ac-2566]|uniref:excisionase family DNA-binding protein n=1 Tax=Kribbella sp. VKM Ac-2566 TaxID=2512218 RepID=UPI001062DED6|nr:excisionase family DNA-binding protein [Kribbella sp. VKM Ac-2566]TDW91274.1 excisionase family DNA binding protein [Kribbella sp. VKM Ac-2566]